MKKKLVFRRKKPSSPSPSPDFIELIRNNHLDTLLQLINQPAFDINRKIRAEQTLLHIAYSGNHYRVVKLLLEHGANPFLEDQNGRSVYKIALDSPDSRSKQILLQHLEDINVIIQHGQHDIIRDRLIEGRITPTDGLITWLLQKNDSQLLKACLQFTVPPEIQRKICQYCMSTDNIDMYRNVIKGTILKPVLKEELKKTTPWRKSYLSEQEIEFLLNIDEFNPDFLETVNITDRNLLRRLTVRSGSWRGMTFQSSDGQGFIQQQHINFSEYLENGYQYGVRITAGDSVNHILINTDSPAAKALFLTGLQLGIMTCCIRQVKSAENSIQLEEAIAGKLFYHQKASKKWIKYSYAGINNEGRHQFVPLDQVKNTCDNIQFNNLMDFIDKSDKTYYLTSESTPVAVRENNLNLEQQEFIRRCWQISPLRLQLLQEILALPRIILTDISSRQIYNNILINLDGRKYKLGNIFPVSSIDYDQYEIKIDSPGAEPGFSILLACGANTDALNYISIPSDRIYHMVDLDLYAHKADDLQRLLSWSSNCSWISGRIYTISTGTLVGYYYPDLIPDPLKHQWQFRFIDIGITGNRQQKRPDIMLIPSNPFSELKNIEDETMTEEDRKTINEFLYQFYQSTGNPKDRENIQTHFSDNRYIRQAFNKESDELILTDTRFPLLLQVIQSDDGIKIITGTDITKKALSNDSRFKTAVLMTQGERKLLNWEQAGAELIITCWSGRRTIRLLASRRFTGQLCLFDKDGSEYTEQLLKFIIHLENHFKQKNPIPLTEFNDIFGRPLAAIYRQHNEEIVEEDLEKQDDIFQNADPDKKNITELKQKYELDKKPGCILLMLDDGSIFILRESMGVFSCDCQREKSPAELESGETIITFSFKEEKYTDITGILIKVDIINRIFNRTQGWRKLLQEQIKREGYNTVYATICSQIREISEITFRNWADLTHYQIGPKERITHRKIWELYSRDKSETEISAEWQKINEFRIFKLILGNRLGEVMNSSWSENPEETVHSLFTQIFEYLEINEKERQILYKQMKKLIQTAEEQTIIGIVKAD